MPLSEKIAIVTGGAKGIGLACAERLARDGAKVVIADIDDSEGEASCEAIMASGGEASFINCDVGKKLDVRNMVAAVVDLHGRIDILVNNAGIVADGDFLEISEKRFRPGHQGQPQGRLSGWPERGPPDGGPA